MLLGQALMVFFASSAMVDVPDPDSGNRLQEARRFLIQLQNLSPAEILEADPDLLVVDYSWDGSSGREMTREDVRRLKTRDGADRIVLAYMSVGEAEDYRFYWDSMLEKGRDAILVKRNRRWRGNYLVRYWEPKWHDILYRGEDSYLQRILDKGFDGVFLDTVDAAEVHVKKGIEDAGARMAALVLAITRAARAVDPGFLVVAQNPFPILEEEGVLDVLSGVTAEAMLFRGERRSHRRVRELLVWKLQGLMERGMAVLVIEYLRTKKAKRRLRAICSENGFLCYSGPRLLGSVGWVVEP